MDKAAIFFHAYRPAAVINVTGDDAFSFLQGQFANDLQGAAAGGAAYGLWLNQKGKVLADSDIMRLGENRFLVVSGSSPASIIRQRLEEYIVADDVTLADDTEEFHGLALWGAQCGERLADAAGVQPARGRFVRKAGLVIFSGRRSSGENYEIIGPANEIGTIRERLLQLGCAEIGFAETELVRIAAGIPNIPRDIGPGDLPNEGGLELTAISYTKGCYLGQEVMARLKNLGQVRRQLRAVRGEGEAPKTGTGLFQAGRKVGETRSSAATGGAFLAMAMLTRMGLDENVRLSFSADGPATLEFYSHG